MRINSEKYKYHTFIEYTTHQLVENYHKDHSPNNIYVRPIDFKKFLEELNDFILQNYGGDNTARMLKPMGKKQVISVISQICRYI